MAHTLPPPLPSTCVQFLMFERQCLLLNRISRLPVVLLISIRITKDMTFKRFKKVTRFFFTKETLLPHFYLKSFIKTDYEKLGLQKFK